jgi:integrin beta 3
MRKAEKEALVASVGTFIAARVDRALSPVLTVVEAQLAATPQAKDGKDADPREVAEIVRSEISAEVKSIRDIVEAIPDVPALPDIPALVTRAVAGLPGIVAETVKAEVAKLPPAEKGDPGEPGRDGENGKDGVDGNDGSAGLDGKDADPQEIAALLLPEVEKAVAAIPVPKDGRDGTDVDFTKVAHLVAEEVAKVAAKIPVPKDGKDGANGKDGIGIAETLINRSGELVMTRTDGSAATVGVVVGRDGVDGKDGAAGIDGKDGTSGERGDPGERGEKGDPGIDGRDADPVEVAKHLIPEVERAVSSIPVPKDGRDGIDGKDGSTGEKGDIGERGSDGLGFEDMRVEYDGERAVTLLFERGEERKEYALGIPIPIDRGIYEQGRKYARGDVVSYGGSAFIAQQDTDSKPETDKTWRLAVKRGRDGARGKDAPPDNSNVPFGDK